MLASSRAPTGSRLGPRPAGDCVGEVRVLPDAVAQHRVRLFELAGELAVRHPERAEAGAAQAEGLHERLDLRLLRERDWPCSHRVRGRHGPLPEGPGRAVRDDVARRAFHLQIEDFRIDLQEPKRPRLLPQPPALVPFLDRPQSDRSRGQTQLQKGDGSVREVSRRIAVTRIAPLGSDAASFRGLTPGFAVVDMFEIEAMGWGC
jgi:hypothetical protein